MSASKLDDAFLLGYFSAVAFSNPLNFTLKPFERFLAITVSRVKLPCLMRILWSYLTISSTYWMSFFTSDSFKKVLPSFSMHFLTLYSFGFSMMRKEWSLSWKESESLATSLILPHLIKISLSLVATVTKLAAILSSTLFMTKSLPVFLCRTR